MRFADPTIRRSGIHIGGSELLALFFEEACELAADRLEILAPYVDERALRDDRVRALWQRLLTIAAVTFVVRTPSAAEAVLSSLPTRRVPRLDVWIYPRLHAKIFVASRGGTAIALVGSHNLTVAALHTNAEAGVLIAPRLDAKHRQLVEQLRHQARTLVRSSTRYSGCTDLRVSRGGHRPRLVTEASLNGRTTFPSSANVRRRVTLGGTSQTPDTQAFAAPCHQRHGGCR